MMYIISSSLGGGNIVAVFKIPVTNDSCDNLITFNESESLAESAVILPISTYMSVYVYIAVNAG